MKIRDARQLRHMTLREVAESCGITITHYVFIENYERRPNILLAIRIAKALYMDPADLFREEYYSPELLERKNKPRPYYKKKIQD